MAASCLVLFELIDRHRRGAEQHVLLRLGEIGGKALEGVPEHLVGDGNLLHRKIFLRQMLH